MKKIDVVAVGSVKESYWRAANEEYRKRLSAYCDLRIIEVRESRIKADSNQGLVGKILQEEGSEINKHLGASNSILLDIAGTSLDSIAWAQLVRKYYDHAAPLTFIIGGSHGVSAEIKHVAREKISFSAMTFPHQLFRTMLLEQLYRAFRILHNEPYHK